MYDDLFKKFNAIQTSNTSNLVKKADSDTKIEKVDKNPNHEKLITT